MSWTGTEQGAEPGAEPGTEPGAEPGSADSRTGEADPGSCLVCLAVGGTSSNGNLATLEDLIKERKINVRKTLFLLMVPVEVRVSVLVRLSTVSLVLL